MLTVDPVVLPDAYWNELYPPQTLTASNGQPPYTWSIVGGSLPPGLILSPGGVISGAPTSVITNNFWVQVTDAVSDVAAINLSIRVKHRVFRCYSCHRDTDF